MKLLIVILAIGAVASAERIDVRAGGLARSISSQVIDAMEKMREQMPCGFPKYGVPPLAPLKLEHKELGLKTEAVSVEGEVNKARVEGLDKFVIEDLKVNVIFSKITFDLLFPNIVVKSLYDLETVAKAYGFTVNVKGKGNMLMDIQGLRIKGTVKYSIFGDIKLKSMDISVSIEDVDSEIDGILGEGFGNRKMNEFLEELMLIGVNDNKEMITKSIEDNALPVVNEALEGYTIADIIAAIGGESTEPVVCIPPEDN